MLEVMKIADNKMLEQKVLCIGFIWLFK